MTIERSTTTHGLAKSKHGYQRQNGRWEARFRPQSRWELARNRKTQEAYKGYTNGVYRYEFLNYFDTKEEKDEWLTSIRAQFNSWRDQARIAHEGPVVVGVSPPGGPKNGTTHAKAAAARPKSRRSSKNKKSIETEEGETKQNDCIVPSLTSQGAPRVMLKLMAARQQVSHKRSINVRLSAPVAAAQPEEVNDFLALLMNDCDVDSDDDMVLGAPVDVRCDLDTSMDVRVAVESRIDNFLNKTDAQPVARRLDLNFPEFDDKLMDYSGLGDFGCFYEI